MAQLTISTLAGIATVSMAPPGGFMTSETVAELAAAIAALRDDAAVRAIILTGGEAGIFIRHFSVVELERMSDALRAKGLRFSPERPVKERDIDHLFTMIGDCPKPVIAAINGTAMGGGFELALACDLRVAEAGPYDLGLPEVRLGILPGAGGTQRLARIVGPARAMELALRGRTMKPEEALSLGLVQQVSTSALDAAMAIAREIAAHPPLAVAHIKRLIRHESGAPLPGALAIERTLFLDLLTSDAAKRLMTAFNAATASKKGVSLADFSND